jgi:ATP-dependent NAD(P)H-hydrate dehydratase
MISQSEALLEQLLQSKNSKNEEDLIFQTKSLLESLLSPDKRKGDNGRFAVIGGSFEYTGAPYYAGTSILAGGGDLCHVFCTRDAAIPIKSYGPDLMVHPLIPKTIDTEKWDTADPYIG